MLPHTQLINMHPSKINTKQPKKQMHFTVGYGARGIRGCVATRDITAGEDIMAIPLETAAVHLKHYDFDAFAAVSSGATT